ncbi:hypothetical protein M8C21_024959 [Ambrosia artemisiifolia]|uniref:Uncharacterized protein n=1 Tax=Ambrosia artemisiifolia TaxID=4212 RepID=A0AAD5BK16_AMBAR|nr:hypothetical protein M8C21_024959 [Ambrosia artemisiifolia]
MSARFGSVRRSGRLAKDGHSEKHPIMLDVSHESQAASAKTKKLTGNDDPDDDFVDTSKKITRPFVKEDPDDDFVDPPPKVARFTKNMVARLPLAKTENLPGLRLFYVDHQATYKKAVESIGFGSLLGFKLASIPPKMGYWLVQNYNPDTCVLNLGSHQIHITQELPKLKKASLKKKADKVRDLKPKEDLSKDSVVDDVAEMCQTADTLQNAGAGGNEEMGGNIVEDDDDDLGLGPFRHCKEYFFSQQDSQAIRPYVGDDGEYIIPVVLALECTQGQENTWGEPDTEMVEAPLDIQHENTLSGSDHEDPDINIAADDDFNKNEDVECSLDLHFEDITVVGIVPHIFVQVTKPGGVNVLVLWGFKYNLPSSEKM